MGSLRTDTLQLRLITDGEGNVTASLSNVERGLARVGKAGESLVGTFEKVKGTIGAVIGAEAIRMLVEYTAAQQRLATQLNVVTGSLEKTQALMARFEDITTPVAGVEELTAAYIELNKSGIEPTAENLQSFANIAAGQAKTIEQVAGAIEAAAQGQTRGLRELGITAEESGGKLRVTFQGVTTEIANDGRAIVGYLTDIGNTKYAGAAAKEAETLGGALKLLANSGKDLVAQFGESSGVQSSLTSLVNLLREAAEWTKENIRLRGINWGITDPKALEESEVRLDEIEQRVKRLRELAAQSTEPTLGDAFGLGQSDQAKKDVAAANDELKRLLAERQAIINDAKRIAQEGVDALGKAQGTRTDGQEKIGEAARKAIEQLEHQVSVYGQVESATLSVAKAEALKTLNTDAERAAVGKLYDQLIKLARAHEADTKDTTLSAAQQKFLNELHAEGVEQMRANVAEEAAARDAIDKRTEAYKRLLAAIDPLAAEQQQLAEGVKILDQQLQAGLIDQEQWEQRFAQLLDHVKPEDFGAVGHKVASAFDEAIRSDLEDTSRALTEILTEGFSAAGDISQNLIKSIAKNTLQAIFKEQLEGPLSDLLKGKGTGSIGDLFNVFKGGQEGAQGAASGQQGSYAQLGSGLLQAGAMAAGQAIGGGGQGAAIGSAIGGAIGSYYGPVGSMVGAIIGGAIGGLFDSKDDPSVRVGGANRPEGSAVGPLGRVSVGTNDIHDRTPTQIAGDIAEFDRAIAQLLGPEELARARSAVAAINKTYDGSASSLETILADRLTAIVNAVKPAWAGFLNQIADVEARVKAFEGLRNIEQQLVELDDAAQKLSGDPLDELRVQLRQLDRDVQKTADDLASAIAAQDPVRIAQAAKAAQDAVVKRYEAEIAMVERLESALADLDTTARRFAVEIAQRIAGVSGGALGPVLTVLRTNMATTRGLVGSARTPEQSLRYLDEFIGTVDQWLQQSRAEVQRWLEEQVKALDTEEQGIYAGAQARADAEAEAQREGDAAAQAAHQAAVDALQEQLRLAEAWVDVLGQADEFIRRMRYSSANPLGAESRLGLLQNDISAGLGGLGGLKGDAQSNEAKRLLDLLNEELGLAQDLQQRPGTDYAATYNRILAQIQQVRGIAAPEADRARELQEQLNALSAETRDAVNDLTGTTVQLSAAEQARVDDIEAERTRLQQEAQDKLDDIDEEARGYYTWAQTEGQRLQEEQRDILQQQLDEITGGMPVQLFIAETQAQARDLLANIRDDLREFLSAISTAGTGSTGTAPAGPGGGVVGPVQPPGGDKQPAVIAPTLQVNVTTTGGDPNQIANVVSAELYRQLPQFASRLKLELKTA